MRTSSVLSILIVALSTPALAADADLKQQVEQIGSAYAAGIAALYANGGVLVNAAGPQADIENTTKVRSRPDLITRK